MQAFRHRKAHSKTYNLLAVLCLSSSLHSCSPAAEETAPGDEGSTTTETNAGTGSGGGESEFETGKASTSVTGASLANLDFNCTSERGTFVYDETTYIGSRLECTPSISATERIASQSSNADHYVATLASGTTVKWTLERKFGEFYKTYACGIGGDTSSLNFACYFNEVNRAAQSVVTLEIEVPDGMQLLSTVGSKQKEYEFENDCDAMPSNLSSYDEYGLGTQSDPYVWCKPAQLADFRTNVTGSHGDLSAYYRIGADLGTVGGSQMIGSTTSPFKGVIQGNGHSFSLTVDLYGNVTGGNDYFGLIRYAENATLDYFVISSLNLITSSLLSPGGSTIAFGGLVGYAKNTQVSRITIGSFTVSLDLFGRGLGAIGALVGIADGATLSHVTVANATSNGIKFEHRGGVVGLMLGSQASYIAASSMTISNSTGGDEAYTGGIVGRMDAASSLSYASTSDSSIRGADAGGVVGKNAGTLFKCQAENVTVVGDSYTKLAGGLVGNNTGTITKSFVSDGEVGLDGQFGSRIVGGFAGRNSGEISNSYSDTVLTTESIFGSPLPTGGFIGDSLAGSVYSNNYSVANFTGSDEHGGFLGTYSGGTFNSNFWNSTVGSAAEGDALNGDDITGVISATTAALKQQNTFTGWDFSTVWQLVSGSYPSLR